MAIDPATIFTSAKVAYDMAKGINALKTSVERDEAVAKVLDILLSVQHDALSMQKDHSLLLREKDDLIKKIAEFEKWSEIERQYELKEITTGVFVYAYKKTDDNRQPMHWLCAKCYSDRKNYILQLKLESAAGPVYICHNCNSEIIDHSKAMRFDPPASGGGMGSRFGTW